MSKSFFTTSFVKNTCSLFSSILSKLNSERVKSSSIYHVAWEPSESIPLINLFPFCDWAITSSRERRTVPFGGMLISPFVVILGAPVIQGAMLLTVTFLSRRVSSSLIGVSITLSMIFSTVLVGDSSSCVVTFPAVVVSSTSVFSIVLPFLLFSVYFFWYAILHPRYHLFFIFQLIFVFNLII